MFAENCTRGLSVTSIAAGIVTIVFAASEPLHAQQASSVMPHWLEIAGILPAPTYDPYTSQIPRRRPGHAAVPLPQVVIQNPDAVNPAPVDQAGEFLPVPDRWRIMESLGFKYPLWDPYNQNTLKADKPIKGDDHFFNINLISDTILEPRSIPTPVGPQATADPGRLDVLGDINQTIFAQTAIVSLDYYIGDTTFKPPEIEYRATLAFQYNRVDTDEDRALQANPLRGTNRDDGFIGVQELWVDKHLRDVSARYDFDSLRIGIQPFNSDFRGFLFQDSSLGIRLFGNRDNNRWQYNLAWFRRLNKDINSGLNNVTQAPRKDDILLANLYRQDFPVRGFTSQATIVYNRNRENSAFYDSNGFIQRPSSLGLEQSRDYDVTYLGYSGDGHFGRLNLTMSAYGAFGNQTPGVFVNQKTDIRAGFVAAEASMDFDWIRVRASGAWASGDDNPFDNRSTGFDAIFENPIFAGADTSYWIRQNVPLIGGGGVALSSRNGILNNLRSSKEDGQSNFDNPGLRMIGLGGDFDVTPRTRLSANVNELWFDQTEILETARNQGYIDRHIGTDASISWIYRPFFTQNIVFRLSAAGLFPGDGFKDLYGDKHDVYYSVLGNLVLSY